jgi:hypothetical protein
MRPGGKEFLQSLRRLWNGIRARDADHVKALGAGGLDERGLERCCGQKSRLA